MKNRKKTIIAVLVIVTLILSLVKCSCNGKPQTEKKAVVANSFSLTNPPIPQLNIPYQKFIIDASKPCVLYTHYGTKIIIPSNAFLDNNRNIIKDKVELSFREFYNPLDFYLAGIPMNYEQNGIEKVFESGGMVELNAKSNKNELFVNPANKIKVDLYSWTKSNEFNLYDLDKTNGKWIEKGKDSISGSNRDTNFNSLPEIPSLPKIATENSFKIKDETKTYPEIAHYENVLFEPIDLSKCEISDAQEMSVKQLKNGKFEVKSILKFGNLRKENTCECYLAFEAGKDYNTALKTYQKKYAYLLKQRQLFKDKIKLQWDNYYAVVNEYRKFDVKKLNGEEKIIRTLTINNFGFVNCDTPINYPTGGEINPIYVDENGNSLQLNNVVLVEKNTNALFRYTSTLKYNPDNNNILWGITKDNKIAYIKNDDFKTLSRTKSRQKVKMHVYKEKMITYQDVMKVLF